MNIILRRNQVGDPFAQNIAAGMPGFQVVNKDTHPIPQMTGNDWCIRWGTTSTVPGGPKVINSAAAIHKVYDKGKFRKLLSDNGLAPWTYLDFGDFLDDHSDPDLGKWIVRPAHHVRSLDLHLCATTSAAYKAFVKCGPGAYISKYVKKDSEYRVFVAQGRVLALIKKVPTDPQAVSWGCVDQGAFVYQNWSEWSVAPLLVAVKAFLLSDLDFGAVDVIVKDGTAYVLEINTAPEVTPYYGKTIAKAFNHMIANGRENIPVTGTTWKHLIHPALSSEAI